MPIVRSTGRYSMYPLGDASDRLSWEDFIVTRNPDGSRTAQTMSRFPGCSVVRHVTQTVSADFTPLDGHVRLFVDNVLKGIVVRRVVGDKVTSIVIPADDGPIDQQTIQLDGPDMVLGYHPTTAEGWKLQKLDRGSSEKQTLRLLTVSLTWNGGTLGHGRKVEMPVCYRGKEEITVAAGTFLCDRYHWDTGDIDGELDIWTTGDDAILARMYGHAKGYGYELEEYETTTFGDTPEYSY